MMKTKRVKKEKIQKFLQELDSGDYKGLTVNVLINNDSVKIYWIGGEWIVVYLKALGYVHEFKFYKTFIPK